MNAIIRKINQQKIIPIEKIENNSTNIVSKVLINQMISTLFEPNNSSNISIKNVCEKITLSFPSFFSFLNYNKNSKEQRENLIEVVKIEISKYKKINGAYGISVNNIFYFILFLFYFIFILKFIIFISIIFLLFFFIFFLKFIIFL